MVNSHKPVTGDTPAALRRSDRAIARVAPREIDAGELFAGAHALLIRHGEDYYTLRRTSKGKLILTK